MALSPARRKHEAKQTQGILQPESDTITYLKE
jgi:hypothetical protein